MCPTFRTAGSRAQFLYILLHIAIYVAKLDSVTYTCSKRWKEMNFIWFGCMNVTYVWCMHARACDLPPMYTVYLITSSNKCTSHFSSCTGKAWKRESVPPEIVTISESSAHSQHLQLDIRGLRNFVATVYFYQRITRTSDSEFGMNSYYIYQCIVTYIYG